LGDSEKQSHIVALTQGFAHKTLARKRDFYAGGLMILLGSVAAVKGPGYRIGTLMHMGPGFMPTALGVILICLGLVIAAPALGAPHGDEERILPEHPQWLGWGCILAGPLLFMLCGSYGGLMPGIFACVFVSALGDRTATWKSAVVLAAVVTAFGIGLFSYVLQVPMPILAWRG
jgi:putative tricarboxylic transport membrane protein